VSLLIAASWNVHRCTGGDRRLDVGRVAEVVGELEADLVVLQEVESGRGPDGRSQLEDLAAATGLTAIPGPIDEAHRRGFGNAMLTRLRALETRNHNLAVPRLERRAALDVDLDVEGQLVRVIGTHLGLFGWERRQQVMQLVSILGEDPVSPTLLLGDFNEWNPSDRNLLPLHERMGTVPLRPRTFPARRPLAALDRIWARPGVSLLHVRAHDSPLARVASDHLPIVAAVKV
jgi:endonuclease/exonuclease/phosphatase family metal-dependent hydrolase